MNRRILFYVQYLLGIGHVVRALRVANALADAGLDVHMAFGAAPIADLDLGRVTAHYLPSLQSAGASYSVLVGAHGRKADEAYLNARRDRLVALFHDIAPAALIVEAFPFGRRAMRFELLPLLEAARAATPAPLVVSSIRDLLHENRQARRDEETAALVEAAFDLVLVHGDPDLFTLDDSFPLARRIGGKVRYTGLVAPESPPGWAGEPFDVIVSAGGGAVGEHVLETALAARPRTRFANARWCLVTGPNYPKDRAERLCGEAPEGVSVTPFVANFCSALSAARLSISQCGYNTAADVMVAGCRAVFIPSALDGETEQTRRAEKLSRRGLGVAVAEADLTVEALARAVEQACALPRADAGALPDLDGARRGAEIVVAELKRRE